MTRTITWAAPSAASNHEKLHLGPAAEAIADLGAHRIVIRNPTDGKMVGFSVDPDGTLIETGKFDEIPDLEKVETGKILRLTIQKLYRDASNYKLAHQEAFEGVVFDGDIDALLTAFFMDEEGMIPHQIGMSDIQHQEGWDLDFENGTDHPWHQVQIITTGEAKGDADSLARLVALCRGRIAGKWDPIAAMIHLIEANGEKP